MRRATYIAMIGLGLGLGLNSCAPRAKPEPPPQMPYPAYLLKDKNSIKLNTFTLQQGDFPVLKALAPETPGGCVPLDRALVAKHVFERYTEHGYALKPNEQFNYGKIHVQLMGYDRENVVGVLYVTRESYETPVPSPDGKIPSGLWRTIKDPVRVNVPELLMLEQLNADERAYIALINGLQFCVPENDKDAGLAKALKELDARLDLYLTWLDARAEVKEEAAKKEAAAKGQGKP